MQRILALKVCFAVTTGDLSVNKLDMQQSQFVNYTVK